MSPTAPPQAKQLCTPPERHKRCPFGWLVPPVWDHTSGLHRLGRRRQRGLLLCAVLKGHPNSSGLKFSSISTGAKSKRRRGQVTRRPAQRAVSKILPPSVRFGLRDFKPKADFPQSVGTYLCPEGKSRCSARCALSHKVLFSEFFCQTHQKCVCKPTLWQSNCPNYTEATTTFTPPTPHSTQPAGPGFSGTFGDVSTEASSLSPKKHTRPS